MVKLPRQLSPDQGAALGVAFVTSALALGSCFGLSFSDVMGGPDLKSVIEDVGEDRIPEDVRYEALRSIQDHERALEGDWIAIWGGSATSAYLSIQLARLAGLKVAVIVDQARHGHWLSADSHARPDLLIDNSDPDRAVNVLAATIGDILHFGIDTNGKDSASFLLKALQQRRRRRNSSSSSSSNSKKSPHYSPSPPPTPPIPRARTERRAHLIGLAGLPKQDEHDDDDDDGKDLQMHSVPLKLFHEVPEVGRVLCEWMEVLLQSGKLRAPRILGNHIGLADVNGALDRMRNGEIRGGKLVVTV
ncbi:Alcohol dehydrogenase superfamily, zinc-type [Beauveria brongniartii RCEF 3172]|uniref:Alcohol dehydrogenase superfamily, zinc-type n=1 Tax=Beauveria brongniartii RCEF 3172 TaxID=1081107 RepID=A0A167BUT1_9HYPO|nr:Alcohol dehydrogenase superfamily, zinc-type [Beauveria brongniartii RCEF 3172]